jgi:pantetheine-phosphate adenylyltransferase
MRKAVYAGSFDPVTNGHMWIIREAAKLFDQVVVAIGENFDKSYSFSVEKRIEFLKAATEGIKNIEVSSFSNEFLVHYASRLGALYVVRGIRNAADYEYEKSMRHINSDLNKDVSTIFLLPPRNYAEVSSSMVKGLVGSTGWETIVKNYVPELVFDELKLRFEQQKKAKGLYVE